MGLTGSRLAELAAIDFGIQGIGWALSSALKTERFYDCTGSLTYWILTLRARSYAQESAGHGELSLRQQVASACVLAWSLRLGSFLAKRAWKYGDSRFDKVKHNPKVFLIYWMVQGVWCFLTALPVYLQLSMPAEKPVPVGVVDYVAWAGWAAGFITEVVADSQKSAWREAGNKSFIDSGLFRYSQHPNYFGEMLLWVSLCASCVKGMGDSDRSYLPKLAALASPAFVCYLLRFVSGVPMLQKAALKKYGNDPSYQAYIARTNLLFPWFPRSA